MKKQELIRVDKVELRLWNRNADEILVIVGGNSDTNETFIELVEKLYKKGLQSDVVTISFQKGKTRITPGLEIQKEDLSKVLKFLQKKDYSEINILCTSDGAYSTSQIVGSNKFNECLGTVIFLDPADYYLSSGSLDEPNFLWSGYNKYEQQEPVVSDFLKEIQGDVKVHVVHLPIRNYSKYGYASNRSMDNERFFARLNKDMVYAFYEKVPKTNRVEYVEIDSIPHAFMRDGDVEKNLIKLTDYITNIV